MSVKYGQKDRNWKGYRMMESLLLVVSGIELFSFESLRDLHGRNAFHVSVDQLLGRKRVKEQSDPKSARLFNCLRRIESLPQRERKGLLLVLDGLLAKHVPAGDGRMTGTMSHPQSFFGGQRWRPDRR